jgi:hypothetical protein
MPANHVKVPENAIGVMDLVNVRVALVQEKMNQERTVRIVKELVTAIHVTVLVNVIGVTVQVKKSLDINLL